MIMKLRHLDFIQGLINHLAFAFFQMRGWSVLLWSTLLVVVCIRTESFEVGLISLLVFWGLGGYFLSQERLFWKLYDCNALAEREMPLTSPWMSQG